MIASPLIVDAGVWISLSHAHANRRESTALTRRVRRAGRALPYNLRGRGRLAIAPYQTPMRNPGNPAWSTVGISAAEVSRVPAWPPLCSPPW